MHNITGVSCLSLLFTIGYASCTGFVLWMEPSKENFRSYIFTRMKLGYRERKSMKSSTKFLEIYLLHLTQLLSGLGTLMKVESLLKMKSILVDLACP